MLRRLVTSPFQGHPVKRGELCFAKSCLPKFFKHTKVRRRITCKVSNQDTYRLLYGIYVSF